MSLVGVYRMTRVERPCGEPLACRTVARPAGTCSSASCFSCWSSKYLVFKIPSEAFFFLSLPLSFPIPSQSWTFWCSGGVVERILNVTHNQISLKCISSFCFNPDSYPTSELSLQVSNLSLILPFLSTSPFLTFLLLTLTVPYPISLLISCDLDGGGLQLESQTVCFSLFLVGFRSWKFSGLFSMCCQKALLSTLASVWVYNITLHL